jgi:hypothetical protein
MIPLLPERASEHELAEAIASSPSLGSKFELKSGYIVEKAQGGGLDALTAEERNRVAASRNIACAAEFATLLHSIPFRMLGVTGSTSYLSASRSRDLDLFCVSPAGRLWSSLAGALILARIYGIAHPASAKLCLSCIMDEDYAEAAFTKEQDPLFARDALATIVLKGGDVYLSLLEKGRWMSSIYPSAYAAKAERLRQGRNPRPNPSLLHVIIDRFAFVLVGTFLRTKSAALNRSLRRRGGEGTTFTVRAGVGHLIYESNRYAALRQTYSVLSSTPSEGTAISMGETGSIKQSMMGSR